MNPAPHHAILIGLGSNQRPRPSLARAVRRLGESFDEVRLSTFYWTRPLGDPSQPRYVNGVAAATTSRTPAEVRQILRAIEYECGRVRDPSARFASRTLDLDLLAYGATPLPREALPAADLLERDFCLLPAAELWPDWVHPVAGQTLQALARECFPAPPNLIEPVRFRLGTRPRPEPGRAC